ncbi:MAG: methyltransferase domain-containing protein, partial [Proteobacteria bacterium]|nr:methyltransferase domain-containing protein [Pseudomonadota bacterium]
MNAYPHLINGDPNCHQALNQARFAGLVPLIRRFGHLIRLQAARLGRMVEPGQRVLELGTGPGTVTRILHSKGCKVTGVEMDPE